MKRILLATVLMLAFVAQAHAFTWVDGSWNATTQTLSWSTPGDVVRLYCPSNNPGIVCAVGNLAPPVGQPSVFKIYNVTLCPPNARDCYQPTVGIAPVATGGGNIDIQDNIYLQPHALIEIDAEASNWYAVVYSSEVQE